MGSQQSISIQQESSGIRINWMDGHQSFFHYVWLRDCCYCEHCGNGYSSNRFLQPCDVALDIRPDNLEVRDDNNLFISWCGDGHQSQYELNWLRLHCYSNESLEQRFHRPTLWDGGISDHIPDVDYAMVSAEPSERLQLYRKLRDFGFVVVRDGPADDDGLKQIASLLGAIAESAYGKVFELSPQSKIKTLGNTLSPVAPHTDEAFRHSPPGINVLHCIRPAETGGESVLVDGFNLGEILRHDNPSGFELLSKQPQAYHRIDRDSDVDQRTRAPVFVLDENDAIVGFRYHTRSAAPFDVPEDRFLEVYKANHTLSKLMLDKQYQARFKLEAGDAVMFDNQRVMHARMGFSDTQRKMKICNVSRESFHERLRLSAYRLGHVEESQQILATGIGG